MEKGLIQFTANQVVYEMAHLGSDDSAPHDLDEADAELFAMGGELGVVVAAKMVKALACFASGKSIVARPATYKSAGYHT